MSKKLVNEVPTGIRSFAKDANRPRREPRFLSPAHAAATTFSMGLRQDSIDVPRIPFLVRMPGNFRNANLVALSASGCVNGMGRLALQNTGCTTEYGLTSYSGSCRA
jgi:hypothetical protein